MRLFFSYALAPSTSVVLKESLALLFVLQLGLFSNGLSSFVSDEEREDGEDEGTNAGLELTVHGVEFRPFVFFDGHGELMGHVFSSTASTLTPAYQVTTTTYSGF